LWNWYRVRELRVSLRMCSATTDQPAYKKDSGVADQWIPVANDGNQMATQPRVLMIEKYPQSQPRASFGDFLRNGAIEKSFRNGRCDLVIKWPNIEVLAGSGNETTSIQRAKWMQTLNDSADSIWGISFMIDDFNTTHTYKYVMETSAVVDFCHLKDVEAPGDSISTEVLKLDEKTLE